MNREEAINIIEGLYPADSEYPDSREIGITLLEQAKRETNNWRNCSDEIILRYACLCEIQKVKQRK